VNSCLDKRELLALLDTLAETNPDIEQAASPEIEQEEAGDGYGDEMGWNDPIGHIIVHQEEEEDEEDLFGAAEVDYR